MRLKALVVTSDRIKVITTLNMTEQIIFCESLSILIIKPLCRCLQHPRAPYTGSSSP